MAVSRNILLLVTAAALLSAHAALGGDQTGGKTTHPSAAKGKAADGEAVQPQYWFGVAVENIPPHYARQLKLKSDQGLCVIAVLPDSPAERAGLAPYDFLIEIDGQPLTSQEQLARAANARSDVKALVMGVKASTITFLRDGDRHTLQIAAALRPENMLVIGPDARSFTPVKPQNAAPANGPDMTTYVLPNGTAAQVGPGYQMDLQGESSTVRVLRPLMSKGETVVMTEETDAAGARKCTITVGSAKYVVEPGKLDALPPEIRPLAEQFLANGANGQAQAQPKNSAATRDPQTTEQRMDDLEKTNKELRQMLNELTRLLKENGGDQGGK